MAEISTIPCEDNKEFKIYQEKGKGDRVRVNISVAVPSGSDYASDGKSYYIERADLESFKKLCHAEEVKEPPTEAKTPLSKPGTVDYLIANTVEGEISFTPDNSGKLATIDSSVVIIKPVRVIDKVSSPLLRAKVPPTWHRISFGHQTYFLTQDQYNQYSPHFTDQGKPKIHYFRKNT